MIRSSLFRLTAVAVIALSMSGCALLSSPDPVQTYRFGGVPGDAGATLPASAVSVRLRRVEFPQATEADRLLGVTGSETAYIKGVRWVAPATDLYMESVEAAFADQAQRVRLIGAREQVTAVKSLDIDVRSFEARYDTPGAAPTIVITARVRLMTLPERGAGPERTFTVRQVASENRVASIVEAFDIATRDLNTQIVSWTDATAG